MEENDYTVFTCQDLEFELELVVQSVAKKIAFIDNQVRLPMSQTKYMMDLMGIILRLSHAT